MPHGMPVPDMILHRGRSALLDNAVDLVTLQTVLDHTSVHKTASTDWRGERAKKQAVGTLHVQCR